MAMNDNRRQAREWAIQMLTAADLNPPAGSDELLAAFWRQISDLEETDGGAATVAARTKRFAEDRVKGVLEHLQEIDDILVPLLQNWDLYRLGTVERAVLRLGVWELKYGGVPAGAAINEAIDLANWFSTPKSRPLVNGVLDHFAKSLK